MTAVVHAFDAGSTAPYLLFHFPSTPRSTMPSLRTQLQWPQQKLVQRHTPFISQMQALGVHVE